MAIETHIRDIELATNARDMREPIADAFRDLNNKFDNLQIDETPIEDSTHLVESGGVYDLWNTLIDPESLLLPTDEIITGEKVITQPGTYEAADDNLDGYSKVIVDQSVGKLDANLQPKYIYAPGEYHPEDDNCDGYSEVIVEPGDVELYVPLIERTVSGTIDRFDIAYVGPYALYSCSLLSTVIFQTCRQIGSHAFENCMLLSAVSCFQCTLISENAFSACSNLTSVTLGGVESIPAYAFNDCSMLSYLSFGINHNIFYTVTPSSYFDGIVYGIDEYAFNNCYKLSGSYNNTYDPFNGSNRTYYTGFTVMQDIGSYAFCNCYEFDAPISMRFVTDASAFTNERNWHDTYSYSTTHIIGDCAFCNCYKLSSINCFITNVGDGVGPDLYSETDTDLIIGKSAFKNCYNSLHLNVMSPQTHIGEYAFENCLDLHLDYYGDPEVTIGSYAFKGARFASTYSIHFHEGVAYTAYIGKYAFQSCNGGGAFINSPRSAEHCIIDEYAFDHNYALTRFALNKHEVMPSAFANCENLYAIHLYSGTILHSNAFYNCTNFNRIIIPFTHASEVVIDDDAFANTGFDTYSIDSGLEPPVIKIGVGTTTAWEEWLAHPGLSKYVSYCVSTTDQMILQDIYY